MGIVLSKLINNVFYDSLTFEKMYDAFLRAKTNKSNRPEVIEFEYNVERNIVRLVNSIEDGTYKIGDYREFKVYEPKERVIKALPFRDRVVHQWFVHEFLIKYIVPKFIYDSYACLDGKGTHKAVNRLERFMYNAMLEYGEYYILKMDIKKFFYNINPKILFKILQKYFKDKEFLNLASKLIFCEDDSIGIAIGNYTSQYFANLYLNTLDQYIKHNLKIKFFLRYMDDFVLLVKDKEVAKEVFKKIEIFLKEELELELNHKSKYYPSSMGVDFCGYRVFHTHKLVRVRSKKQMRGRIKCWNKLYQEDNLVVKEVLQSFNAWRGHIRHANSYNLFIRYVAKLDFDIKNLISYK